MIKELQRLRDLVECITRIDYVPTNLRTEVKELLVKSYVESNVYFSQLEETLKRNEPMKVIYPSTNSITKYSWNEPACPKCKTLVSEEEKFCCECGQALDWSSSNE